MFLEKWTVYNESWDKPKVVSLIDVVGVKWEKLEKPWKDPENFEFPYTIKVFMKNGETYYMGHYCDGSQSGHDFKDLIMYMNQLYEFWVKGE